MNSRNEPHLINEFQCNFKFAIVKRSDLSSYLTIENKHYLLENKFTEEEWHERGLETMKFSSNH